MALSPPIYNKKGKLDGGMGGVSKLGRGAVSMEAAAVAGDIFFFRKPHSNHMTHGAHISFSLSLFPPSPNGIRTLRPSPTPIKYLPSLPHPDSSMCPSMAVLGLGVGLAVGSSLPSGTAGWSSFFHSCLRPNPKPLTHVRHVGNLFHRRLPRLLPVLALDSDVPRPIHRGSEKLNNSKSLEQWDSLTAKFAAGSNIPFLLLQLPQIILNARNLTAGNKTALLAVPWLGMLTGLLGNLSLLSYFAKKREAEAVMVQALGVVSTYVVIAQLAMGEAMPLPHFTVTSIVVASGLVLNFLFYFGLLNKTLWHLWEDFITIGGVSVLPQVIWSTLVPFIPNSILPGAISSVVGLAAVVMARTGKLPEKGVKFIKAISGWTATLLFMWMPVAQMMTNLVSPENIKGLSAFTMLLAMIGNGLMIPRALFIRDFMWFLGSSWASFFYGWGNLICLYYSNVISREFFLAATVGLYGWIGIAFWRDSKVYGYNSPLASLKALVSGS